MARDLASCGGSCSRWLFRWASTWRSVSTTKPRLTRVAHARGHACPARRRRHTTADSAGSAANPVRPGARRSRPGGLLLRGRPARTALRIAGLLDARRPCASYSAWAQTSPTWFTRIRPALWRCFLGVQFAVRRQRAGIGREALATPPTTRSALSKPTIRWSRGLMARVSLSMALLYRARLSAAAASRAPAPPPPASRGSSPRPGSVPAGRDRIGGTSVQVSPKTAMKRGDCSVGSTFRRS